MDGDLSFHGRACRKQSSASNLYIDAKAAYHFKWPQYGEDHQVGMTLQGPFSPRMATGAPARVPPANTSVLTPDLNASYQLVADTWRDQPQPARNPQGIADENVTTTWWRTCGASPAEMMAVVSRRMLSNDAAKLRAPGHLNHSLKHALPL